MPSEVKLMDLKKERLQIKDTEPKKQDTKVTRETTVGKFKLRDWIEGIKQEIRAINWTTKEELRVYTQIVVGATFFFGMGVYLVDLVLHGGMNTLTWLSRLLVG